MKDNKIFIEEVKSDNLFNFNLSNTQNRTVSYSINATVSNLRSGMLLKATMTNDGKIKVEPFKPLLDTELSKK
jgi:hypothetical protein